MINLKNIKDTANHLKTHQSYPATKEELVAECNRLSDFSDEDKKWFTDHLPDRTYNSADEVMSALGIKEQATQAM